MQHINLHKCAEYLENLKRNTLRIHVYALLCAIIRKEEPNKEIINTSITTNTCTTSTSILLYFRTPTIHIRTRSSNQPIPSNFINKAKTVSNKPAIEVHFNSCIQVFVYSSITARNNAYDKFVRFTVAK